jgi:hypothetical protein
VTRESAFKHRVRVVNGLGPTVAITGLALVALFAIDKTLNGIIGTGPAISATSAIVSAMALIFLGFQVSYQVRVTNAQFIQQLAQDVDQHVMTELMLDKGGGLYALKEHLDREEESSLILFLTFFERLSYNVDHGVENMKAYDRLFSYRFFLLVHNPNVQKHILLNPNMKSSWVYIFTLHKKWLDYKHTRSLPVIREDGIEGLVADDFYQACQVG